MASKSVLHRCQCVPALTWPVANQLSATEGRVDRHAIDWGWNWKEGWLMAVFCYLLV